MTISYTDEAKFPLNEDGGGNWGAIINGVLEALDQGLRLCFTAGEDISEGDAVALLAADGKMYKALSTSETLTPAIGIAIADVDADDEGLVLGFGWIEVHTSYGGGSSVDFTAGDHVYVGSTAGQLSATRDSWSSPVGYAKADTNSSWDTRICVRPGPRRAELVDQISIDKQAHFTQEVWLGALGAGEVVDWTQGNNQAGVLDNDCALSFTPPSGPAHLTLRLQGDAVGGHVVTWPVAVQWANGGTAQAVSLGATYTDIWCGYYDGSGNYYGSLATSFA